MANWKKVEGFPTYSVSDEGKIRNDNRNRILKGTVDKAGYVHVQLVRKKKITNVYVHRAVAAAFHPNPLSLPEVNHMDKVRGNNLASNLEWCTLTWNKIHATGKRASFISPEGVKHDCHGIGQFAREHNLCPVNMRRVASGKQKQHKGWT